MTRTIHTTLALAVFLALFCARPAPVHADSLRILAFGDSITQGFARDYYGRWWGLETPPRGGRVSWWGYGRYLERMIGDGLGVEGLVYNWGYGGLTSAMALTCGRNWDCIDVVLTSRPADMVLIMLGANDLNDGISHTATAHNLDVMLRKSHAQGVQPVLGTITPNTRVRGANAYIHYHYNPRIRHLARTRGVLLADQYDALLPHWNAYQSGDGLHLGDHGNRKLAETWYNAIRNNAQGVRVTINPAQIRPSAARWRVVGTRLWHPHGFTQRLQPGRHVVEFSTLPGWRTPPNQEIQVRRNQTSTVHALYAANQGIRVVIRPDRVRLGGMWRIIGTNVWRPHEFQQPARPGRHVIQFKPIPGWRPPPNQVVFLRQGQLMTIVGQYVAR